MYNKLYILRINLKYNFFNNTIYRYKDILSILFGFFSSYIGWISKWYY